MASLKDIRRRIGSVKNTQQITKAMKVVAASKLRRAQQAIAGARPFADKLEELTAALIGEIIQTEALTDSAKVEEFLKKLHPLLQVRGQQTDDFETARKKIALLVVSSDRGLCGAYNSTVLKAAWKRYNELISNPENDVSLYFAGRRGQDFFKKRGVSGTWFEEVFLGRFSNTRSDKIANALTEKFLSGEVDEVEAIYTEFRSALSQVVTLKQILPLSVKAPSDAVKTSTLSTSAVHNAAAGVENSALHAGAPNTSAEYSAPYTSAEYSAPYIYEPSRVELLAQLLPKQVQTQFYKILADSLASELGSRMTAMDNATRNAGDMISRLTLEANRVRQASITKELMEIIGGAEALKG